MLPHLSSIWFEMELANWHTRILNGSICLFDGYTISIWMDHRFGNVFTRKQIVQISRMFDKWLREGYFPAGKTSLMRWGHCRDHRQPAYYRKIFGCKLWS